MTNKLIPTLSKLLRNRNIRLALGLVALVVLGSSVSARGQVLGQRVEAVGNLNFTYPNDPGGPVFTVSNMLPGDCRSEVVGAENTAPSASMIAVRSQNEQDLDNLSSQLFMTISEASTDLYGGSQGIKTVQDFFSDSQSVNGVALSNLAGNGSTTDYVFTICFDPTAGNEYQNTQVIFDLVFGEIFSPIQLPDVCSHLQGIITHEIVGTAGKDKIKGTGASELIRGLEGDDKIDGGGGDDCIIGGPGKDKIDGGSGNDTITGDEGEDNLDGGSGDDKVYGGADNDKIDGGSDTDYIEGNDGDDRIDGSHGVDTVYAGSGNDRVDGGSFDDLIYGEEGDDRLEGGSGADTIYGGPGNDDVRGGSGNDLLDGQADNDKADGDSGTDTCIAEITDSCEL